MQLKDQVKAQRELSTLELVDELSTLAVEEPQIALSAYTKGICHRWTFIQRTLDGISPLFQPLEDCIRQKLIPSIVGRNVSDLERRIFSLPVRYGGLGIANPVETCNREYQASKTITEGLSELIYRQEQDLSLLDTAEQNNHINEQKKNKDDFTKDKLKELALQSNDQNMKRALELNNEKGTGSWLTTLPLKEHGFCLNKQEFRDALCLRYGWNVPNMPPFCGCGSKNSIDHTLICKKGGYIFMRHNALRDLNANLQMEVCRDVVVKPSLLPLNQEEVEGAHGDRAAPDISSRGYGAPLKGRFMMFVSFIRMHHHTDLLILHNFTGNTNLKR